MRLIIRQEASATSAYVAQYIIKRIKTFDPTPQRPFVLGLPTGSSPVGVYKNLVAAHQAGAISFKNVITFNMDEYVGIDPTHPQSYHSFMYEHRKWRNGLSKRKWVLIAVLVLSVFNHVDIPPSQINILNGKASDLALECKRYEDKIKSYGGVELFLGGIGEDGHIAFNEPGSSLNSRTRIKTLAKDTIEANSRFFGNDIHAVPRMSLTVGVATILEAREIVLIITGQRKALALSKCIEEGVNHLWTVSAIQLHPWALVCCDKDATMELRVKTVEYFKSIEVMQDEVEQYQERERKKLAMNGNTNGATNGTS